ncbi:MAG: LysO family transporter [Thermotogota bacterium]|nr:LysO family transporter [Thermotogota bacterium]
MPLLMLFLILVAFITGLLLGLKKRLRFLSKFKIIPLITLLLLFSMGTEIGQSQEIMSNLDSIGLNAFLIALFAVAGSFFVTLFFLKLVKIKKGEPDD